MVGGHGFLPFWCDYLKDNLTYFLRYAILQNLVYTTSCIAFCNQG